MSTDGNYMLDDMKLSSLCSTCRYLGNLNHLNLLQ